MTAIGFGMTSSLRSSRRREARKPGVTSQIHLNGYLSSLPRLARERAHPLTRRMTDEPEIAARFARDGYGAGNAWIDLVNSEQFDANGRRTDHLDDPRWLGQLLRHYGLVAERTGAQDLASLRRFLRSVAEALTLGDDLTSEQIAAINRHMASPARQVLSTTGDGYRLDWSTIRTGGPALRASFAASLAAFLATQDTGRLKICANPLCRWVFYDRSKNNTRRWCSDKACGNRDKVRRLRRRRAGAADGCV
ncbi:CGNR zinc finger domain-containing protein [Marinivivus vitaminiproducens]|uniref:CGNR zinc finger domain-containing protein n=1 Tax=Marinivivus vitaminiproducens TaxID=3035935 RepID=UPI00279DC28D|nr:CGNR zinc finger domain-containing protein [Geminicoccaceae bacterium SCSIO 64248]